ncbi:hypothetical protein OTU49_009640 [Cherax quadricarinatus]|uniref:Pro-corazonin n=1 Tax=Cherax quadricarinatus TaxID=27406 RepID=A0A2U8JAF0_CHEQU|nr:corazonin [Cherax quadricarinatus]
MEKRNSQVVLMVVLVVALTVSLTAAQTFQYSRGWTNGRKRSDPSVGVVRDVTDLLADSTHRLPSHRPLPPTHALPKNLEERLRALELGLNAALKASATFPPAADDQYYSDN